MAEHNNTKNQSEKSTDSAITEIVESLETISTEVQAIAERTSGSLTEAIKKHPYVSLGMAAGLGYLLSRLL